MAQELAPDNTQTHTSSPKQFKWLQFTQQRTEPIEPIVIPVSEGHKPELPPTPSTKRPYLRYVAVGIVLALAAAMYVVWHTSQAPSAAVGMTQQNFTVSGSGSTKSAPLSQTADVTHAGGEIQVYVIGAVHHPGVYNLPAGARVYQLLQAAGGTLPNANLVALNLAARLNDGQEVYVLRIGETPPTLVGGTSSQATTTTGTTGQLVNINTATSDELRQSLHISAKTAQNIINYRLQHGPYSSVDQLLQLKIVSLAIYNKIKDQVTV